MGHFVLLSEVSSPLLPLRCPPIPLATPRHLAARKLRRTAAAHFHCASALHPPPPLPLLFSFLVLRRQPSNRHLLHQPRPRLPRSLLAAPSRPRPRTRALPDGGALQFGHASRRGRRRGRHDRRCPRCCHTGLRRATRRPRRRLHSVPPSPPLPSLARWSHDRPTLAQRYRPILNPDTLCGRLLVCLFTSSHPLLSLPRVQYALHTNLTLRAPATNVRLRTAGGASGLPDENFVRAQRREARMADWCALTLQVAKARAAHYPAALGHCR